MGSLTRRSSKSSRRPSPVTGASGPLISGPTLLNSVDMSERMQRLGCVELPSSAIAAAQDAFNNNNSTGGKPGVECECASVSNTQYRLPTDYVLGTFPREILQTVVRPDTISNGSGGHYQAASCTCRLNTKRRRSNSNSSNDINSTKHSKRRSIYDNVPMDTDDHISILPERPTTPPTSSSKESSTTTTERKELDAVLHDLLINITNFDLDMDGSSTLTRQEVGQQSHLVIASPLSEDLSSLADSPSDAESTPVDSPELPRSGPRVGGAELSIDDLSGSTEKLIEEEGDDDEGIREMQETIWRERRDSGVGSSLTREPL